MHPSLKPYEDRVDQGFIRRVDKGDLVLYNYTDHCTYERAWDEYTRNARGIVFHKDTGEVIARPFPKFFNLGETEETMFKNLPKGSYSVSEKMDGSLGIIYYYEGEWHVNTRGSFTSDQAIKGLELLRKYNMEDFPRNLTLLVEIIYPSNKIVVNYGAREELVILGAVHTQSGSDWSHTVRNEFTEIGMPVAPAYNHTIEEMIALQKTIPKDNEGFVVHFHENNLRVKIKGEEYMKIAKLLADLSPLALWENMEGGKVKTEVLEQIPEEFRNEWEPIQIVLEDKWRHVHQEIILDIHKLPIDVENLDKIEMTPDVRRTIGKAIAAEPGKFKHPGGIFPWFMGNLDGYIMKLIRPTGNKL